MSGDSLLFRATLQLLIDKYMVSLWYRLVVVLQLVLLLLLANKLFLGNYRMIGTLSGLT